MFLRPWPTLLFYSILMVGLVIAKPINVTVDDRYGPFPRVGENITYQQGWFDSGLDKCPPCATFSAYQSAFNGTWMRATYDRGTPQDEPKFASLKFNGTAIYVNIIQAPASAAHVVGNTELLFTLDGVTTTFEADAPSGVNAQVAFAQSALGVGEHTLTIQNGQVNGKYDPVIVFLDSIVYTTDDSVLAPQKDNNSAPVVTSQPDHPKSFDNKVAITAGICGALGGILLLLLSLLLYRCIKRRKTQILPLNSERWRSGRYDEPPPSVTSWHPSLFVRSLQSKHPASDYAPSVASSKRHMLSRSSMASSWSDPSHRDDPTEYDTTDASKSVRVGSTREYTNPYGRRDPLEAVQEWQQRQSHLRDLGRQYPMMKATITRASFASEPPSGLAYVPQPPTSPLQHLTVVNK